ncbi:MAG TPA: HAMP domain-containing histidine kinase [Bacteroidetes bacterium]|nr:HAMP domain-containing histidine kinase [Bacteroidota bacterium]
MHKQKLRLFSYIVMVYMLLAFTWWALLLLSKNKEILRAKADLLKSEMLAAGHIIPQGEFEKTGQYQALLREYQRQERMVFGEASVFVLTLVAGMWFIHGSYHREVSASQQQRNFLLAITHELKSPIASIQLVLETFLKRDLPKDKADHLAKTALKENERLHRLVENLLLSAKLETAYRPHFEEVNLDEMLQDLLAKAANRHPQAVLNYEAADNFPLIKVDPSSMALLVNNLVDNAVKYSDGKPEIDVRLDARPSFAVLTIADRGIGVPDAEKKNIFNKFYRIGNEETRKTKGTGLGLFIVNQIVKAHKGRIQVLDNQPKGTVFKIELPM